MSNNALNKRILVADDEHFMRALIIQALNSLGFGNILEAEHGKHALQLMSKHPVDIVISDIEMEPLNGFELVKMIRLGNTPIARDSRIIVLSGFSDTSTLTSMLMLDVQGFLVKPVSANDLLKKILGVLQMNVKLRDPSAYESLRLTPARLNADISHKPDHNTVTKIAAKSAVRSLKKQVANAAPIDNQPIPADHILLKVDMLRPGMIVCKDIYARGVLLLRKGALLQLEHILVLKDMRNVLERKEIEVKIPLSIHNEVSGQV